MNENLDFVQDYYPRKAIGIYKYGYDSKRLKKWLSFYDRSYYVNINEYDLMDSILSVFK